MLKVIIVEDEDLLRDGLSTCVEWEKLGCELAGTAEDGVKALALIERVNPDVVITDIRMPHMDGIELAERIREAYPRIKIVIISGYDEFDYARRALKAGVFEYILKPVKLEQLNSVIRSVSEAVLAEREKEREILKLKDMSRQGLGTLRQTLFSKILLRKQNPEELEELVSQISEYVKGKYYSVGILEQQDFPMVSIDCDYLEIIEMDREFEQMVVRHLQGFEEAGGGEHLEILRSNNCERLFCIIQDSVGEVKNIIREIRSLFDGEGDDLEHLQLTFGCVSKELTGLYKSFLNARELCERKLLENWSRILCRDGSASSALQPMNYDAQALFFQVRSGTVEGINSCLDEFRESLSREKIVSYMQLVMMINNLYFELIQLPEEVGGEHPGDHRGSDGELSSDYREAEAQRDD